MSSLFWNVENEKLNLMELEKKGHVKRKTIRMQKKANITLNCLSKILKDHGRHTMLFFLS